MSKQSTPVRLAILALILASLAGGGRIPSPGAGRQCRRGARRAEWHLTRALR